MRSRVEKKSFLALSIVSSSWTRPPFHAGVAASPHGASIAFGFVATFDFSS